MKKVTLDTNCIISLDKGEEPWASAVKQLIVARHAKILHLRIVAMSASENGRGGAVISKFSEFRNRLDRVGLSDVEILKPMARVDITFWDWCIVTDDALVDQERKIHTILFPNDEQDYHAFCAKKGIDPTDRVGARHWLNHKCDVQSIWSHIYYEGDVFVTNDNHFHKTRVKTKLLQLGAGSIMRPQEAVASLLGKDLV